MTEQRYRAVLQVQAGMSVVEVAEAFGVSRQAVHRWLKWYRDEGLEGLADRSHRPDSHPLQTSPEVGAAICELRRNHPRWGQRRIEFELGRNGCPGPVPYLSTIYRVLVRHGLIDPIPRRRRRQRCRVAAGGFLSEEHPDELGRVPALRFGGRDDLLHGFAQVGHPQPIGQCDGLDELIPGLALS